MRRHRRGRSVTVRSGLDHRVAPQHSNMSTKYEPLHSHARDTLVNLRSSSNIRTATTVARTHVGFSFPLTTRAAKFERNYLQENRQRGRGQLQ